MDLCDRKMVTNTNLKYADSSLNYHVIIMVQNFLTFLNSKILKKIAFRGMKCQPKLNNREAVVVCARDVVKRPSKQLNYIQYNSASTYLAPLTESYSNVPCCNYFG